MSVTTFNPQKIQKDFPILQRKIHSDKRLVYLDNAATSQKPRAVIAAISNYYEQHNANVHRGVHQLGDESTKLFHESRHTIAEFFGAEPTEFIAVRNTTEAINQIAYTWGEKHVAAGDTILTTEMEHHSNIVPWQELAKRKGVRLEFANVNDEGKIDLQNLAQQLAAKKITLLAVTHISNTLGTRNPVEKIVELVRKTSPSTKILIDGAQAAPHIPVDFHKLNVDFYVVSAHKMLGPMGIGGLFVRQKILETLPPFLFGGGMINEVTKEKTTYAEDLEERFTAGTPDVAGLVGWAAACEYLRTIGMEKLAEYDYDLVAYVLEKLHEFPQIKIVGPLSANDRIG